MKNSFGEFLFGFLWIINMEWFLFTKGQIISEATFLGFKSPKKQTKFFEGYFGFLGTVWVKPFVFIENWAVLLFINLVFQLSNGFDINFCQNIISLGINKVHIFSEGHKFLRNLPLTFDYTKVWRKPGFGIGIETKIRFRYRYLSLNFFYLNQNFLRFLFLKFFSCFLCLFFWIIPMSYRVTMLSCKCFSTICLIFIGSFVLVNYLPKMF